MNEELAWLLAFTLAIIAIGGILTLLHMMAHLIDHLRGRGE